MTPGSSCRTRVAAVAYWSTRVFCRAGSKAAKAARCPRSSRDPWARPRRNATGSCTGSTVRVSISCTASLIPASRKGRTAALMSFHVRSARSRSASSPGARSLASRSSTRRPASGADASKARPASTHSRMRVEAPMRSGIASTAAAAAWKRVGWAPGAGTSLDARSRRSSVSRTRLRICGSHGFHTPPVCCRTAGTSWLTWAPDRLRRSRAVRSSSMTARICAGSSGIGWPVR